MIYPIQSETERSRALDYMSRRLGGTILYDHLDPRMLLDQYCGLRVICAGGKPELQDYRYGWGGKASIANDWLVSEVLQHLLADELNMCILEDICRRASDPKLMTGADGPAWSHQDRVFWPITQNKATSELIEKALRWGLIGRVYVIAFCGEPKSMPCLRDSTEISESALTEIGKSTTRLVTDIFDQEGYLDVRFVSS
jgi:hypothetical protein